MAISFLQTLDPVSLAPGSALGNGEREAIAEIVFHGDLRRVGERARLGGVGAVGDLPPVLVGRESPLFVGDEGGAPRGLLDPCLSRQQAMVSWDAERGRFHVVAASDARRPTRLLTLDGHAVEGPFVPPGTLLALGDRVLLLLATRSPHADDDLGLLGHSALAEALRSRIRAVASFDDTVLVRGETGAGKELVAHAVHVASHRAKHPFVALNCAALPESLIESELFGYARGAFSGAAQGKAGLFRAAEGGTLFLDEIGEMPPPLQAKLLRVLASKRIRPVGADAETPIDVRIVAATHRDLASDVAQGRFREDLFGRLASPEIVVPPLRERREDIALLFVAFLKRRALAFAEREGTTLTGTPLGRCWQDATAYRSILPMDLFLDLLAHDWPRNVRELDKLAADVATSIVSGRTPPIRTSLPSRIRSSEAPAPLPQAVASTLEAESDTDFRGRVRPDRAELDRALEQNDFNATDTARALGLPYSTLDRWMRELGLPRPKDLTRADLEPVRARAKGDVREMARALRVSFRGLKVRLKELGMADND